MTIQSLFPINRPIFRLIIYLAKLKLINQFNQPTIPQSITFSLTHQLNRQPPPSINRTPLTLQQTNKFLSANRLLLTFNHQIVPRILLTIRAIILFSSSSNSNSSRSLGSIKTNSNNSLSHFLIQLICISNISKTSSNRSNPSNLSYKTQYQISRYLLPILSASRSSTNFHNLSLSTSLTLWPNFSQIPTNPMEIITCFSTIL